MTNRTPITVGLPRELAELRDSIREIALSYGLDFYDVIFEMVDYQKMNEVAAYLGFPTRYPHWRFGMEYERISKSYAYGLSKIYEMVINSDPCYAYLLKDNALMDQKLVMAHVYAHCDFFKNNMYFAHTNRKMVDEMANHGARIRQYINRYGADTVETFLDCALSLEDLIDPHGPFMNRGEMKAPMDLVEEEEGPVEIGRLKSKEYMDRFINPPEYIQARRDQILAERQQKKRFPPEPVQDVLAFLIEHSPLERWQLNILSIIREEAYYFLPQGQTKIMNEGWATYWHSRMMTRHLATDAEIVSYAEHHAGTLASQPGQINPYKLGVELFRDIERRWDEGRFGLEYDRLTDRKARQDWNTGAGMGEEQIFEVRRIYNDVGFIDAFLTPEFIEDQKLYTYRFNRKTGRNEIVDRDPDNIKRQLLRSLTNLGRPFIQVEDGNYRNRGELYLRHRHEGMELKLDAARDTLRNVCQIWGRPVHIETLVGGKGRVLSFDGSEHSEQEKSLESQDRETLELSTG